MEKKSTVLHAVRIRKIISETIHNFYKPPKKYSRGDPADEYGEETAPVNKSTTIVSAGTKNGGKINQSQMTTDTIGGKGGKKGKKGEEAAELAKLPLKPVFDYGDDKFNIVAEEIWDAREKLNQKTIEK